MTRSWCWWMTGASLATIGRMLIAVTLLLGGLSRGDESTGDRAGTGTADSQSKAGSRAAPARGSLRDRVAERIPGVANRAAPAEQRTLVHAGQTRTAIVHRPAPLKAANDKNAANGRAGNAPREPLPLMIVLHGFLADGEMTRLLTGFNDVADRERFVVAYPDGLGRMWRFWEGTKHAAAIQGAQFVDDPGFLLHLVDDLVAEGLVDSRRVYLTGISNGGFMTNRMAWQYADRFAAIAPVAGTIPNRMLPDANPSRPVPTLIVHGTEDRIVEYAGSEKFGLTGQFIGAAELTAWWSEKNHCRPEETKTLPDTTNDGTVVRVHRHPASPEGAEVVLYEIDGGGHTWPGGSFQPRVLLGEVCRDWNASEAIWEFCARHRLPELKK